MDKVDENRNGLQLRFLKIYWPNIFFKFSFLFITFDTMLGEQICLI